MGVGTRSSSRRRIAGVASALLCGVLWATPGRAGNFDVSNTDELRQAILSINDAPGSNHTINFQQGFTLDSVLTPIIGGPANTIDIVGNGYTLSGGNQFQIFFVDTGTVRIDNLILESGYSRGGDGAMGRGGGGLGAGGALFVNTDARVSITDVFFRNNTAQGGSGGADAGPNVGGGGGGFHGDGADFGGGGGYNGRGGIDGGGGGGLEGNGLPGDQGGSGGGKFDDGDGGDGNPIPGGQGGSGGEFEGGGFGSSGGDGGRFGGGGGGSGIGGGDGGDFGGGGGAADITADTGTEPANPVEGFGGKGGFGGGGGGSSNGTPTNGGFGGGNGTATGIGGAGSSLGGAVFVRSGGELTIGISSRLLALSPNGDVTNGNQVTRAVVGSGTPEIRGSDLYLMNGVDAQVNVGSGITSTFRGTLSGEGGLIKDDDGTLVLVGANSYTGGTTVQAGVLQGTTTSLPGDIVVESGGTLRFEQSSGGSYAGVLSGAGDLVKAGAGTVSLTGANDFTGSTTIEEGILSVTAASLGTTSGTSVADGATLRFDQAGDASYAQPITSGGAGSMLEKRGAGSLTLAADYSSWAGSTQVTGGELVVAGTLGGALDVGSGGRLGGSGTVLGDTSIAGDLAPGPSGTQTLTLGGLLDLQPGAIFEVDVTDTGQSDQVSVGGAADVDGALVTVLPASGDYTSSITYDILTAAGGVTGAPLAQDDFCFFDTLLAINGNTLQLTLNPALELDGSCSGTRNQRAVGTALQPVVLGDPALTEVRDALNVLTETQVAGALDQMSGEGLAGFGNARLAIATRFLGSVSQRMRDPSPGEDQSGVPYPLSMTQPLLPGLDAGAALAGPLDASAIAGRLQVPGAAFARRPASPFTFVSQRAESGLGGWLDGFATFASVDGSGGGSAGGAGSLALGSHDQDFNLYGTAGGVDWAFTDGGLVGAAFGYTRSKLSVSDLTTWGTGDTFQGALYGTWASELFYVGGAVRYAWTEMDTTRRITFGSIYEKADGDFHGSSISGYLETGLAALEGWGSFLQPSASFQYTYLDTEEFTESGAPGLNLNLDSESFNSQILNLGVRVYHPFEMDPSTDLVPELRVRWAHEFGDLDRTVSARFDDVTTGPAVFRVKGADVGRDAAVVGAGWTVVGENNMVLSLNYDATLNQNLVGHTVAVGVLIYW